MTITLVISSGANWASEFHLDIMNHSRQHLLQLLRTQTAQELSANCLRKPGVVPGPKQDSVVICGVYARRRC